jgi:hypothetical protein
MQAADQRTIHSNEAAPVQRLSLVERVEAVEVDHL